MKRQKMDTSATGCSSLRDQVANFMMRYLLPLPIVRRSYKLRLRYDNVMSHAMNELPPDISEVVMIGSQYEGLVVTITFTDSGDAYHALSDFDMMPVVKNYVARDPDVDVGVVMDNDRTVVNNDNYATPLNKAQDTVEKNSDTHNTLINNGTDVTSENGDTSVTSVDNDSGFTPANNDTDVATTNDNISDKKNTNKDDVEILEISEGSYPGYCKLRSVRTGRFVGMRFQADCSGMVDIYEGDEITGHINIHYKDLFSVFFEKPEPEVMALFVHGPAICYRSARTHPGEVARTGQEIDFVLSMKCQSWPKAAESWFSRVRNHDWPGHKLIEKVKETGCYVVGVAHASSPSPEHEWRFSFAPVEKVLAKSYNYVKRGIYILAKILLKSIVKEGDGVSTYCLKTQMFWMCELEDSKNWKYDNIGHHALKLLSQLTANLRLGELKHYFIPENNIIGHIQPSDLAVGTKKLEAFLENPFPILTKVRQTTKYFGTIVHPPESAFTPLTSLLGSLSNSDLEIRSRFQETKHAVMRHYCTMLKKPVTNGIQEEFCRLKFIMLTYVAEDMAHDISASNPADETVRIVYDELVQHNADNAKKWLGFAEEYRNVGDEINSQDPQVVIPILEEKGYRAMETF